MIRSHRQTNFLIRETSTPGAGLRGVGGIHSDYPDPGAFCLESEYVEEVSPSRVIDGLCQHAARESLHGEIFMRDKPVLVHEFPRRLVVKVFSLVSDMVMKFRNLQYGFLAAAAPLLLAGKSALGDAKFLLCFSEELRGIHELTVARDQKRLQPKVDADRRISGRSDFNIRQFQMKHRAPFSGFAANCDGGDAGVFRQFPMPFDFHGADILQDDLAVFQAASISVGEADGIESPDAFEARVSGILAFFEPVKEVLKCGVETAKGMLTGREICARKVLACESQRLERGRLFAVLYRLARFLIRSLAPLQGIIVQTPMQFKSMLKRGSLLTVRVQPICKCFVHSLAFLRFDVMSDRLFGDRPDGTSVIRPAPQSWKAAPQGSKFFSQYVAGISFHPRNNLRNALGWIVLNKKMYVVRHDFKRMNCQTKFCGLLVQEFGKPVFNITNQYLAAILRTPNYV